MAKKKVVVKKGTKVSSDVKNSDNQAAIKAMAPAASRGPSSISAKSGSNPQARTVKVKANKQLKANSMRSDGKDMIKSKDVRSDGKDMIKSKTMEPVSTLSANTTPMVGQLSATFAPNPNLSALGDVSVGEANDSEMGNIYDERIGGFGNAKKTADGKWAESGEQAVKRIVKVKGNTAKIKTAKPKAAKK